MENGDLLARQVKLTASGVEYYVKTDREKLHIKTQLPGRFNVYNSLAAVGVGLSLSLAKSQIEEGIFSLSQVAGRMNHIDEGQNFDVIIDFAHTPDAFAKLMPDLKKVAKGRVIAVFGSAGERDATKRPEMGEIAGANCDILVLTEEDYRSENVRDIMNEIAKGAEKAGKVREKDLFMVDNRESAFQFAFDLAKKDDVVLLLGKGPEETINRGGKEFPWDEDKTARKLLKQIVAKK